MSMPRIWERAEGFWFPIDSDKWLAVLRVGLGLQVVVYTLSLKK